MKATSSDLLDWVTSLALTAAFLVATPAISFAQSTERFDYDALGRLTRVQTPTSITVYSYDAAGNRSVVSVTSSSPPSAAKSRVVVVPSGTGFMVIPLK